MESNQEAKNKNQEWQKPELVRLSERIYGGPHAGVPETVRYVGQPGTPPYGADS